MKFEYMILLEIVLVCSQSVETLNNPSFLFRLDSPAKIVFHMNCFRAFLNE